MKTSTSTSKLKRTALIALLIFSAAATQANPLNYIMGSEATGLDLVYIILGVAAIWMLLFFEGYNGDEDKIEKSSVKIRISDESNHHRKVVRKTN
jgi:uncharacterized membrane protein YuzA (DUF378 family)